MADRLPGSSDRFPRFDLFLIAFDLGSPFQSRTVTCIVRVSSKGTFVDVVSLLPRVSLLGGDSSGTEKVVKVAISMRRLVAVRRRAHVCPSGIKVFTTDQTINALTL